MSKKKNKFKKNKKRQIAENIAAPVRTVELQNPITEPVAEQTISAPTPAAADGSDAYHTDKYDHVKNDIKKILVIMLIIILVLIGVYILSLKTEILTTFGNWVYKILNIQAS